VAGGTLTDLLIATRDGIHGPDGVHLEGRAITALASDRWGVWALADGRTLVRRTAGPWVEVEEVSELPGRSLLSAEEGLFVGTAEAGLLRLEEGVLGEVEGFAKVPGRDGWYTPWGGPPDTRSMTRGADGFLYVSVHVGGIPRSRDGGRTWEPTIDVDADVHQVTAHPTDPGVLLAACAPGLARSDDGGRTWTMDDHGLHAPYCRAVALAGDEPDRPDTVLVSASTGPRTERGAVYRRPLEDGTFERCAEGLPEWFPSNVDTQCLAARGPTAVIGGPDDAVYRSEDAGRTWEQVAEGLPAITGVVLLPPDR
jgi:photosystem II stability/assembly factor-like uncharacterized protein